MDLVFLIQASGSSVPVEANMIVSGNAAKQRSRRPQNRQPGGSDRRVATCRNHLDMCVISTYMLETMENAMTNKATVRKERITRDDRLGFRLDEQTKGLIERAAQLERRKISDYCLTAIAEAARRTIAEHEKLTLSERDRAAFFDAMIHPPEPSERLARALADHARRVGA